MIRRYLILFCFSVFLISGCKSLNFDKVQKTRDTLSQTRQQLSKNTDNKMNQIAVLSAGTEYSLNKITNAPVEVKTAIDLNSRVINIAGSPDFSELTRIKYTIDLLNSEVDIERKKGEELLRQRDLTIASLQNEKKEIVNVYETHIQGLELQASNIAKKADKLQGTVDEVNSWMGLGGIFYGLKRFISLGLIGLLIGGVGFMALRFFSTVNPIAGAIFSVFEHIGGWFVSMIKGIAPKAVQFSKHIETEIFSKYKQALDNIVYSVENMQATQKKSGIKLSMDEMLSQMDKDLNDPDKKLIEEIKAEIKYTQ